MLSPNGIKSILFDLDGTLRHQIPEGGDLFTEHAVSLGVMINDEDRLRAKRWEHYYFASSPEIKADQALFKENKFWVAFGKRRLVALGCSARQAEELALPLSEFMRENYQPQIHIPAAARPLLAALNEAGFILGVVSNREKNFHAELIQLDLAQHVHFSLAGGEVQSFKPEPGIFAEALRRAGTSAHETMYVGDNYFADVVGSLRAGLQPVLYDPNGLFPEAECAVIRSFDQLPGLLK
ncbi:MAG: Phosphoglycolate phosphatase [Anaerolineales bacterium]|nr:Phosphoglycolate phosphatase [Anaerolineales bacterium]